MNERHQPIEMATTSLKPTSGIVTVRCGSCAQRLGRSSPALAVVDLSTPDRQVFRIKRISAKQRDRMRAAAQAQGQAQDPLAERMGDLLADPPEAPPDPLADRSPWVSVAWVDRTRGIIRTPKGVELACPRCPHRPRKRLRDLFEVAEQALADDRAEVYL